MTSLFFKLSCPALCRERSNGTHSTGSTCSRGSRHLLVAAGVDGANILEAEVPLQVRLHKGRHKAATGSIHVDLDIVTLQADWFQAKDPPHARIHMRVAAETVIITLHADSVSSQSPIHTFIRSLQLSRSEEDWVSSQRPTHSCIRSLQLSRSEEDWVSSQRPIHTFIRSLQLSRREEDWVSSQRPIHTFICSVQLSRSVQV